MDPLVPPVRPLLAPGDLKGLLAFMASTGRSRPGPSAEETDGGPSALSSQTQQPPLAIEWRAFNYEYNGDFRVAGIPVLLPPGGPLRRPEEQIHGDTGTNALLKLPSRDERE